MSPMKVAMVLLGVSLVVTGVSMSLALGQPEGVDRAVVAEAMLAERLWRQACPVPEIDGLCAVPMPALSTRAAGLPACAPLASFRAPKLEVRARRPQLVDEALLHARKALTLYQAGAAEPGISGDPDSADYKIRLGALRSHVALAMLLESERGFEEFLSLQMPGNLDFDPARKMEQKESIKRFKSWMEQKSKLLLTSQRDYQRVIEMKDLGSVIVASGRIGQLFQDFADALFTARLPRLPSTPSGLELLEWQQMFRDAYCDTMLDAGAPLAKKATEAFQSCLSRAHYGSYIGPALKRCEQGFRDTSGPSN